VFVIATAGHVDHGKSALLRALTGMEPDRWEEELRRGLTIDLGFVWMEAAPGPIAFVDVPGHERFVGNMLAGVGSVPAVLFVVAADEGWMPQSAEHLAALNALNVTHGLLAITKTDIMEPELAAEEALEHIRASSLGDIGWLGVSARTGDGLPELRAALDDLVRRLPPVAAQAPIRLWVDRAFTIRGAGVVVTGTLAAGTIRAGDTLELARTGKPYVVREIQSMGRSTDAAHGVARVALNLRGAKRDEIGRGDALMTPDSYRRVVLADVRRPAGDLADLPPRLLVHIGAATVESRIRPLGADTARLTLATALPLRVGDRLVLRTDRGVAGGAIVLDADPPAFTRRGAAKRRAEELTGYSDQPDGRQEVRRRGIVTAAALRAVGVAPPAAPLVGDWLVAPELQRHLAERLTGLAAARQRDPSAPPLKVDDARKALGLPDARLVAPLLAPGWVVRAGMVVRTEAPDTLAAAVRGALAALEAQPHNGFSVLADADLARLGLGPAEVAAAARAGRLIKLAPDVTVRPAALEQAIAVLAALPQPFTAGEARQALGTSRKVVVPLLEHLARAGRTRRDPDGAHRITGR
jgi:selenocysteine-specific elongation factor